MARAGKGTRSRVAGKANARTAVPDVYNEMLAEAVSSPIRKSEDGTPAKRRRVGGRIVSQSVSDNAIQQAEQGLSTKSQDDIDDLFEEPEPTLQRVEQTGSEDSADSDEDFEDVDLGTNFQDHDDSDHETEKPSELNLVLGGDNQKTPRFAQARRKPITSMEKKLRIEIHKMHLCCLFVHVHLRNHWCNDERVHTALRGKLTKKTISYLNPDESLSQFQRSRSFMDGLTQASEALRADFKITTRGMSKPRWADSPETLALLQPPDGIDLPILKLDFLSAAGKFKGSRDVGAQLFCSMLRAAGVDARLVCSMLPLPFQSAQKVTLPQVMPNASRLPYHSSRQATPGTDSEIEAGSDGSLIVEGKVGSSRADIHSRLVQGQRSASPEAYPPIKASRKRIRESKYPVYWVEAFNESVQKWVPIDPLVTKTIAKSSKFEPPAGDSGNNMSYVIAFEDDGSARDVTRRYVKAYNAKTRRDRIEVTKDGEKWLRSVMRLYRRSYGLDRDQVEDAELTTKEAAEPMPRNVQDFRDHPYYALERHLRRHEVIHPKREVGKVGAGRPGTTNVLESIYRRRDVHQVKSADKWYRLGREIKQGEQPLKRVTVHRAKDSPLDRDDVDAADDDNAGTALYAPHQTTLYTAPSVVKGKIPKNVYGNLDVYVPSMVPPGGAHIAHPETARAARILGIDFVDAVTGFLFKGKHGTAIIQGAVVASEYREAVEDIIEAFEDERAQAEEERRSLAALKTWKRFLAGLRIRERIEGYEIEGERDVAMKDEMDQAEDEDEDEGGGFLPDRDADEIAQPTAKSMPMPNLSSFANDKKGGGFFRSGDEQQGTEVPYASTNFVESVYDDHDDEEGGGFQLDKGEQNTPMEGNEEDHQGTSHKNKRPTLHVSAESDSQEVFDQGGGFLADDDITGNKSSSADDFNISSPPKDGILSNDGSINPYSTVQTEEQSMEAIPEMSPGELEEAKMLQQLYESQSPSRLPVSNNDLHAPAPSNPADTLPLQEETTGSDREPSVPRTEGDSDSESEGGDDPERDSSEEDRGSLLSHDPDDEDADPEWLA